VKAELWIHLENVKRHLRRICTLLGLSPFLTGDHVYYLDVPERELVVINADDPRRIEVRDVDLHPGAPTAHLDAKKLRMWEDRECTP